MARNPTPFEIFRTARPVRVGQHYPVGLPAVESLNVLDNGIGYDVVDVIATLFVVPFHRRRVCRGAFAVVGHTVDEGVDGFRHKTFLYQCQQRIGRAPGVPDTVMVVDMVGALPVRVVARTVAGHHQRMIQCGVEQAFPGLVAIDFDTSECAVPFLLGQSRYPVHVFILQFKVTVCSGAINAAQRHADSDVHHGLAQVDARIEFLIPLVGNPDLTARVVDVHGEVHPVRLLAAKSAGIFTPARQHRCGRIPFKCAPMERAADYGNYMLRNAVAHIYQKRLVLTFGIREPVGHRMARGRHFGVDAVTVQMHFIIIRCGNLGGFRRIVAVFLCGERTGLWREEHLSVARPPYSGHVQLTESADPVVFIISVLSAKGSLRRRIDRPVRQLRTYHTVAVAPHAHEHVHHVDGTMRGNVNGRRN